jgi:hypothetical protein
MALHDKLPVLAVLAPAIPTGLYGALVGKASWVEH